MRTRAKDSTAARPLAGIRVIDLSNVFSGPLVTALLADQGASVIKVESPEGDTSRHVGPAKGDLSAAFITANRGKRSIALDLKQTEARQILAELVRNSDVLVSNFRPGVLERLGLDRAHLQELNPALLVLAISGFGPDGPRAEDRAYDAVIQAVAGVAASHRDKHSGEPTLLATTLCDKLTALTAAQAITAALFARSRDGQGRHVEVSMLDATLAFQWVDAMYNHVFLDAPPQGFPEMGVTLKPYATADGLVAVMAPQQSEFAALCRALGRPDIAEDPRFASLQARSRNPGELRALLEPLLAQQQTTALEAASRAEGAPVGRVNERAQVVTDAQVVHNKTLVELDHGDVGRVRLARAAARFDGVALEPKTPAPHLGEHGRAVLREFGFDDAQVARWVESGVVRLHDPRG
jgi:crotonobetainyl-CoA:carnitine CoA-transferase CaiB-like acyl-CoA transferase